MRFPAIGDLWKENQSPGGGRKKTTMGFRVGFRSPRFVDWVGGKENEGTKSLLPLQVMSSPNRFERR